MMRSWTPARRPIRAAEAPARLTAPPPSADAVRAWIQVPATLVPDPMLQQVIDAEARLQSRLCTIPTDVLAVDVPVVRELTNAVAGGDAVMDGGSHDVRLVLGGSTTDADVRTASQLIWRSSKGDGRMQVLGTPVGPVQAADAIIAGGAGTGAQGGTGQRDFLVTSEATGSLTADLTQAIYRRVAREIAARGIPLGMLGADTEYGTARLSRWDAEIERLEGPSRRVVFG